MDRWQIIANGPINSYRRAIGSSPTVGVTPGPNTPPGSESDASAERQADDLAAIIQSLELGPAHIVGHSYGGFVALTLSLRHPEMVRTLVLVEPGVPGLENASASNAVANERRALADEMRKAFDSGDADQIVRMALSPLRTGRIRQSAFGNTRDVSGEYSGF
jgi:pimeloyl-ACP methyl ester carboxylesterase